MKGIEMRRVLLPVMSAIILLGFPDGSRDAAGWGLAYDGQIKDSPSGAATDAGRRDEYDYFEFLYPVYVDSDAPEFMLKSADDLQTLLGPRTMRTKRMKSMQKRERNLGCVFDVRVASFQSLAPPESGYLIRIAYGGAVFEASDAESAKLAVTHLRRVAVRDGERVLIPRGLLTNLPIVK